MRKRIIIWFFLMLRGKKKGFMNRKLDRKRDVARTTHLIYHIQLPLDTCNINSQADQNSAQSLWYYRYNSMEKSSSID